MSLWQKIIAFFSPPPKPKRDKRGRFVKK